MKPPRAVPGREMVLRLTERLAVPLPTQRALLVAAGFNADITANGRWTTRPWLPPSGRWTCCSKP